jgi:hypothetical protein
MRIRQDRGLIEVWAVSREDLIDAMIRGNVRDRRRIRFMSAMKSAGVLLHLLLPGASAIGAAGLPEFATDQPPPRLRRVHPEIPQKLKTFSTKDTKARKGKAARSLPGATLPPRRSSCARPYLPTPGRLDVIACFAATFSSRPCIRFPLIGQQFMEGERQVCSMLNAGAPGALRRFASPYLIYTHSFPVNAYHHGLQR